ncbi:MAG TPA: NAD(P)H-dependent oxidoreductase subunit E, partial [Thermodesulfobacteriota bacterium]|nr:NAD(P)H-dependent oxidoreductase subunit E [Thermodesulfobacteriota bacterium]
MIRPEETKMTEEEGAIVKKTREILKHLGNEERNLIPILQQVQAVLGYLPSLAMLETAQFLNIPEIDVY